MPTLPRGHVGLIEVEVVVRVVDSGSPRGVVPGHEMTLRAYGPVYFTAFLVYLAVFFGGLWALDRWIWASHSDPIATLLVPGVSASAVLLWVMRRRGVRLGPTSLIPHSGLTAHTAVRWDEIDAVRLEKARQFGRITLYGPVLELLSGEVILLDQLTTPTTPRRVPRSRPACHVATIAAYLEHYRPPPPD